MFEGEVSSYQTLGGSSLGIFVSQNVCRGLISSY